MPVIAKNILVSHAPLQMFQIVNDVEEYPKFLPGCVSAKILKKNDCNITANLKIKKGSFMGQFTTKNTLYEPTKIKMVLINGPFSELFGEWSFVSLEKEKGCNVSLFLQYEFKSKLLQLVAGKMFDDLWQDILNAFVVRADKIQGLKNAS
jgi:ribosome-associated toxin RatA of RatAB toxin-antitoxin module